MASSSLCCCYRYRLPSLPQQHRARNQLQGRSTSSTTVSKRRRVFTIRSEAKKEPVPFGYSRKDVLLIGVGVTVAGLGLESGLEWAGVDALTAGNAVQIVMVLGLTVGWIFSYVFRVSNKEMTYAQQLRDYENKVMEKRLEGLNEAELTALMEQVEEEKRRLAAGEKI